MKIIKKPKLWKYKTGLNAGKLRPKAKEYLSYKLKKYYSDKKFFDLQFKEVAPTIRKRTRSQVCYNSHYRMSLRAIGFKGQTEREFENALLECLNSNDSLKHLPFDSSGYEFEEIDEREDRNLDAKFITIELNTRGQTTYTEY